VMVSCFKLFIYIRKCTFVFTMCDILIAKRDSFFGYDGTFRAHKPAEN
jgi:hypothetical protein